MKCLETRRKNGMRWRRYRDEQGVEFTTYEVPCEVVSHLGEARLARILEASERELARRRRNARALSLLQAGWKPTAIAHELGVSDVTIRNIRADGRRALSSRAASSRTSKRSRLSAW